MILAEAGRRRLFNFTLNRNNKLEKEQSSSEEKIVSLLCDYKKKYMVFQPANWRLTPPFFKKKKINILLVLQFLKHNLKSMFSKPPP